MTVMNALALAARLRRQASHCTQADEGGIRSQADAEPPPDVVAVLAAAKPGLLRVLAGREAAKSRARRRSAAGLPAANVD